MSQLITSIISSSTLLAALGWFVVHRLALRRDAETRRISAEKAHLEAQIEQLYGPLLGLVQQSRIVFELAVKILPTKDDQINFSEFSTTDDDAWNYFVESYFLLINARIRELIRAKMHLLDKGEQPKSFEEFFRHEAQFDVLHKLWREKGKDSSTIKGTGFPINFEKDVSDSLVKLRSQHHNLLQYQISSSQSEKEMPK